MAAQELGDATKPQVLTLMSGGDGGGGGDGDGAGAGAGAGGTETAAAASAAAPAAAPAAAAASTSAQAGTSLFLLTEADIACLTAPALYIKALSWTHAATLVV